MSSSPVPSLGSGFATTALLGAAPWVLVAMLTGQREPWDHWLTPYIAALLLAGFLPGWLHARLAWLWALATTVGQVIAFVCLRILPDPVSLWPLGLVLILLSSLLPLAGAALAILLRSRRRHRSGQAPTSP